MLFYTFCALLGLVCQLSALEERTGDGVTPKVKGDEPDYRFLAVEEELARLDRLPRTNFQQLTPEVQKLQTEELKVIGIFIILYILPVLLLL